MTPGSLTPVCSTSDATTTPVAIRSTQHLAGQRPPGARHLRAAGNRGVDVLEVLDRPRAGQVGVADRATRSGAGTTPGRPSAASWPATAGSGRAAAAAPIRSRTPPGSRSTSPGSVQPGTVAVVARCDAPRASSVGLETWSPHCAAVPLASSADGSVALVLRRARSRQSGSSRPGGGGSWSWSRRPSRPRRGQATRASAAAAGRPRRRSGARKPSGPAIMLEQHALASSSAGRPRGAGGSERPPGTSSAVECCAEPSVLEAHAPSTVAQRDRRPGMERPAAPSHGYSR